MLRLPPATTECSLLHISQPVPPSTANRSFLDQCGTVTTLK